MGSALSTFNDFVDSTGPAYLSGPDAVVDEAVKNNYLLRRMLKGADMSRTLQGGSTIKDTILFDEDSTFSFYQPNESFTWSNPQVLEAHEVNWRFAVDHMSWTDQEIELNAGGGLSKSARHHQFKRLKRVKEQRLWTSILNGMESALFAVPDKTKQETAGGTDPYSIPAFVNERTNGLFVNGAGGDWTVIEGINPATESKWRPQTVSYDNLTANDSANLLAAFDEMYLSVKFDTPPTKQEYFENPSLFAQFIACSKDGQTNYTQLLRASQDTLVTPGRQDPAYMKPQYAGIDLEYVSELDSAALYNDVATTGLATEEAADKIGARFYWLNGQYLAPVFHTSRYMVKHPVMTHPNQPFTHIVPCDSWYNVVCRSRQRQGIVSPTTDIAGF